MGIGNLDELRKRATEMVGSGNYAFSENTRDELRTVLHELHTHQIELELQNEELRRVQEELVETRDQYVDLYDFAPVGYLTLSAKNLIVEANLTLADLLGEERRSLLGRPFSRFVFQADQDIFYQHSRELIEANSRRVCDLRLRKKNGDWFWARLECVPKEKSDKSGMRLRIAVNDITEAKRMENDIIKAKKLEATALLAGGIAHDFNNLLAVILGNLEMAQTDMLMGRSIAKELQTAREACLSAGTLTKKFLTFSAGGEPLKERIPVEAFITDAVSLALAGSAVNFECFFPEGLWPVEVDAGQMTQAIANVISNAREAMPQGGAIRIRAENVDSVPGENRQLPGNQGAKFVKVSIQDQGVGIAKEILPQVFDPYFSSKEMGQEKGMGLGLTVAYSIIKNHGGSIDIASQPNIGTTVSMYLPASDRQIVSLETRAELTPMANNKILVMDDEEMLRDVTRDILEMVGYRVETACNGEEAIELYAQAQLAGAPFGAVILDLTIKGGMGGRETIKRLQEIDPDIRAIVVSGYSHDPVMANFKEYGFFDALQKPYRLEDLERSLHAVAQACGKHFSRV
ncbi:MAG: ATP-binding protein [Desulfobulbaceae bacterium]|nr:ATP-binding protein [Desulfobulbaceae bacterium]